MRICGPENEREQQSGGASGGTRRESESGVAVGGLSLSIAKAALFFFICSFLFRPPIEHRRGQGSDSGDFIPASSGSLGR